MSEEQKLSGKVNLRVRYSETDQMGTFYNSRALEWFEVGRTELLRKVQVPQGGCGYVAVEAAGVMLPLVEAHVEYLGRAQYDDELKMEISAAMIGRASLRFDVQIFHAAPERGGVAQGYTVHAITNTEGRAIRPPKWFTEALTAAME